LEWRELRLMIEAGAPSTVSRNTPGSGVVPATPGAVMVALPEAPRNAQRGKVQAALHSKRLEQSP